MPLKKEHSKKAISKNIAELVRAGKTKEQAAAISFKVARRSARAEGKGVAQVKSKNVGRRRVGKIMRGMRGKL